MKLLPVQVRDLISPQKSKNHYCLFLRVLVDGGWTVWIPSTACSEPCGPGFLNESRSCTNPVPQNGGDDCSGDSERVTSCEITPCSSERLGVPNKKLETICFSCLLVDGGFCNWTNDTCSVTCGGLGLGLLTQTRTCDCPTPQHGGANCSGDWSQTTNIDCGVGECPRKKENLALLFL